MAEASVDQFAKIIWDYLCLSREPSTTDVMLVLGGQDLRVADYAAELFSKGLAPLVVVSGGRAHTDDLLRTDWTETEAEKFSIKMIAQGVPKNKIFLEDQATNTGENFSFSRPIIEQQVPSFQSILVVTKPFMERRALATGMKQWPDKVLCVTSPQIDFENYLVGDLPKDDVINIMMGDLQRIDRYGQNGFQIPQEIPESVWQAFNELKTLGYTKHLLPS